MRRATEIKYPEIGICGFSCRLCPRYHTEGKEKCEGCKSKSRVAIGCPFITCAVKEKGIAFCWDCDESGACERWKKHREKAKQHDTFRCCQTLEADLALIDEIGIKKFERDQQAKEQMLNEMLRSFDEGRSKVYYCIAAAVLSVDELIEAMTRARVEAYRCEVRRKSSILHAILDEIASRKGYSLKLRV